MRSFLFSLLWGISCLTALDGSSKIVNPVTDVCWECLFPITVSGQNVTPGYTESTRYREVFCFCHGQPPSAGVPVSFWEPGAMVDVTRHAYKLLGLGGISIGPESTRNRGAVGRLSSGALHSFYNVHYYKWPILTWLGLFTDFDCLEKGDMDIPYISELDPLWNDENLATILGSEAAFFSTPLAKASCVADCLASTMGKSNDKSFWCAGCQGSLYPFSGSVSHHIGGIQASSLLVHRLIAKLHRSVLLLGYEPDEFCGPKPMPIIKKSLYKTQLLIPVAQTKGPCNPLGQSTQVWGAGKSYPHGGEDFVYLLWIKRQCCLDCARYLLSS